MGIQRHLLGFNLWAISLERGLLMALMPNQFKDTIHFDLLLSGTKHLIVGFGLQVRLDNFKIILWAMHGCIFLSARLNTDRTNKFQLGE